MTYYRQATIEEEDKVFEALYCKALGSKNIISRDALSVYSGLSDRIVRKAIEQMRVRGEPIITAPGGGYYLAASQDDVKSAKAFLRKERARAEHILAMCAGVEAGLKNISENA